MYTTKEKRDKTMLNATHRHIFHHTGIGTKLAEMTEGKPIAVILVLVGLIALYLLFYLLEDK
jgi:hypothetical protein